VACELVATIQGSTARPAWPSHPAISSGEREALLVASATPTPRARKADRVAAAPGTGSRPRISTPSTSSTTAP
jgi:hypothetical protein